MVAINLYEQPNKTTVVEEWPLSPKNGFQDFFYCPLLFPQKPNENANSIILNLYETRDLRRETVAKMFKTVKAWLEVVVHDTVLQMSEGDISN